MNRYHLAFILPVALLVSLALPLAAFAQGFVPLTDLPGLSSTEAAPDFTSFLNNLYKLCIGIAAALAVFQIMHAGIKFMTNKGSISENEQAKDLIRGAVLGLLLVLSPVIVFGIINPKILELDLDFSKLQQVTITEVGDDPNIGGNETPSDRFIDNQFLLFRGYDKWIDADNAQKACAVDPTLSDLIADYNKPEIYAKQCNEQENSEGECVDGTEQYLAKCEAKSVQFYMFRPENSPSTSLVAAPGENERINEFTRNCRADGGHPKRDADGILGGCPSAIKEKLEAAEGIPAGPWKCRQVEYLCRAEP